MDKGQQVIYLTPPRPDPKPARVSVNIILFILDGPQRDARWRSTAAGPRAERLAARLRISLKALLSGWPYALSLMSILLAHEFGHYLMSRYHKTRATLPYFIPLPFPPLGTMGAAILMQGTPKNKRVCSTSAWPARWPASLLPSRCCSWDFHCPTSTWSNPWAEWWRWKATRSCICWRSSHVWQAAARACQLWVASPPFDVLAALFLHGPADPNRSHGRLHPSGRLCRLGRPAGDRAEPDPGGHARRRSRRLLLVRRQSRQGLSVYSAGIAGARSLLERLVDLGRVLLLWLGRVHAEPLDQITQLDPARLLIAGPDHPRSSSLPSAPCHLRSSVGL